MAKGYWIAHVTVSDPDQYKHYADAAPGAFAKYKARMLARGGQHAQMEGAGKARNVQVAEAVAQMPSPILVSI